MKNKNRADYTHLQLRAFLDFLLVVGYMTMAFVVVFLLRMYGFGANTILYFGSILFLGIFLLLILVALSRRYIRPFQEIDGQLNALLSNESGEIQLSKGLSATEQHLHILQQAMEKRLFREQLAEQQKNDLVMYLAHDIRTPLTSVIGYLSLLDEAKDMPPEQRDKYTHITLEKAYKLEKMIDEFFEIARYSLQQIQLKQENVDLCYMLVQLTDELLPILAKNGNKAVLQMENEDLLVYADPEKLARVFNNILKNAAVYSTPNTEIVISAKECNGMIEIAFFNQGQEIPPEKLEKLFDKFYRTDEARTGNSGGAGLGLAIAKQIITLHGGTICAKSEDNTVTIIVTIPAGKQ